MFWEATPPEARIFVADPAQGSRHNRGCAVDLTLYDLKTGQAGRDAEPLRRVLNPRPCRLHGRHDRATRALRVRCCAQAMEAEGFTVYAEEWWHFDFDSDYARYPIGTKTFTELAAG